MSACANPFEEVDRTDSPPPACAALQAHRESIDDVQIPSHHRLDAGPANLDDDALARREGRRVHLRDRCGRERRPVKACEHLVDLGAQLEAQYLLDLWPIDLWSVVLQAAQLLDELRGEQITAGREYLSELDERDAAVLER